MRQYRRWLAFAALWIIFIDSHAKEKFAKTPTLTRVIKSSATKLYSFPSEVHDQSNDGCKKFPEHSRDQVKTEVIKDANVKVFSSDVKHDQKPSQLDKSQVNKLRKVNGSIFSYHTGHKSRTVDVRSSTNDRLRINTLIPENRNHKKCPKLLRKSSRISRKLLLNHIEYSKNKVKRNNYEQTKQYNNIDTKTQQNNKRLDINRKWKNFRSDNTTEKCIIKKISIEDQLIKYNELDRNKNIIEKTIINEGKKNLLVLSNEIETKDLEKHLRLTFVGKDSERIPMKTSELTPKIQLDLFTKLLRVKPQTRLANEKSESNNQQLQVKLFFRSNRPYLIKKETTFPRIISLKTHHVQLKNMQHPVINHFNENDNKKPLCARSKKLSLKTRLPYYTKEIKDNPKNIFNKREYQNSQLILDDELNEVKEVNMEKTLKDQQVKSKKLFDTSVVRVKKDISVSGITSNVENTLDSVSSVIPIVYKVDSTKFNSTWGSSTEIVLLDENYNAIAASHSRKLQTTSGQSRDSTSISTIQVPKKIISPTKSYSEDYLSNVTDILFQDEIQTNEITTLSDKEFISSTNLAKTNITSGSKWSFWNPLEESWKLSVKPQQVRSSSMSVLPTDIPELEINTPGWSEDHITTEVLEKIQRTKMDRNLENVTLISLEDSYGILDNSNMHNKTNNVNQLLDPLRRSESRSERSKTEISKMEIELSSRSRNTGETTPKGNTNREVKKSKLSTNSQIVSEKWGKVKPMWDANDTETDVLPNTDSRSIALFTKLTNRISPPITGENGFTTNRDIQTSNHVDHENASLITSNQWPVKHSAVVEGDLVLGGLMMVHEREDTVTCGPIMPQGGIQALEAMLYTLDWLNKRGIVPGVKIGAHILDDCDKDTYGLEMAVDFIKGYICFRWSNGHKGTFNWRTKIKRQYDYSNNINFNKTKIIPSVEQIFESSSLLHHYHLENPQTHHGIRHGDRLIRSKEINSRLPVLLNWPIKKEAVVEGDLVLGGLMMVHEREDSITCGPVMPQGGIQALEAMLYTLDWLNNNKIVPGVKIGAHILDDCDKDTYGLEMAVDFIKGSISNIDGAEYSCNKSTVRKVISGVVGAASSVTSIQVANLLRLFRIPQVSFFSTSPELSNKQRFEYFTRTIPSDHYQVKAMVDIIRKMGWSYVSIIYEESNYGIKAYEELEELLAKNQICIAIKEKLVKDSGVAEETAYDNIVQKLLTKPRARGCIIFGSDQEVAGMMRAVRRNNATGAFYWIGSDGWSARGLVSNKNEPEVEGTLSVQPQANPVEGFEQYFLNLTVENNPRNPWFVEFWEDHFQCRYPNASRTPYNQKYKVSCTKKERLTKQNTAFEDQLQFVSDAVMAFAYAFRDMHADLCHGQPGLCDAIKPTKGTELLKYLKKVQFQGLSGDEFHFDKNGDGPARYNIIHFKQVSPGEYRWIRVGKYLEGELVLNMSEIQFRLDNPAPPESVCSLPCRVGQAKKYVEGESCCWHCLDCTQYQIRHATDQTRCVQCPQGTVPDETHSYCRDIPEEFLKFDSGWAIGAMSFSASGILVTLFVGGVFVKYNDTPIVRASGRELSYVLLTGILLCYLVTFTLILKPTDLVCGIQRFSAGFCFTVVYAALLTKTNRISRIFNKSKKSAKRPSFISPRSQLIICSLLVGIQILINAVWMVIDPAKARHHYPTREDNLLVCNSYIDASYMIAFTYPIILIVVCTVYAVLTRKIPEDFNESKHIGFTMYTTCVIWLAFVPLYFGTGNHVALRITSMSVTISLSASVTIACLFSPKLYIILIHPERNIRRGRGPFALKHSTVARTNASSMISTVTLTAATCDQNKAVKGQTISTIDCSTQSELLEMEVKDFKNGKLPVTLTTRATQTVANNNDKETNVSLSVSNDQSNTDTIEAAKSLNNKKISNGPISKNDITS